MSVGGWSAGAQSPGARRLRISGVGGVRRITRGGSGTATPGLCFGSLPGMERSACTRTTAAAARRASEPTPTRRRPTSVGSDAVPQQKSSSSAGRQPKRVTTMAPRGGTGSAATAVPAKTPRQPHVVAVESVRGDRPARPSAPLRRLPAPRPAPVRTEDHRRVGDRGGVVDPRQRGAAAADTGRVHRGG